MAANTTDKEERAKRRRLRESRARKVLVAGAAFSLAVGTAAIYASNDEPSITTAELPTLESTAETTIAQNEVEPVSTAAINVQTKARAFANTEESEDANNDESEDANTYANTDDDEYENDDEDDNDEGEDEDDYEYQSEAPVATSAPTTNQSPSVTPTPASAEIVIDQPSSHTRSSSTRD
ncbi:hypothetical protein BH09CHL1_BH09CHL1_17940 [soil metagenome]